MLIIIAFHVGSSEMGNLHSTAVTALWFNTKTACMLLADSPAFCDWILSKSGKFGSFTRLCTLGAAIVHEGSKQGYMDGNTGEISQELQQHLLATGWCDGMRSLTKMPSRRPHSGPHSGLLPARSWHLDGRKHGLCTDSYVMSSRPSEAP